MRINKTNNSMSHIHDSLSDPVIPHHAVPMQHYSSNTHKNTSISTSQPRSKQADVPTIMSVDALKRLTSLRLANSRTTNSNTPSSESRSGNATGYYRQGAQVPHQAVLNPHSQNKTARTLLPSQSSPVFQGSGLTPSENSVLVRSTVSNIMTPSNLTTRALKFAGKHLHFGSETVQEEIPTYSTATSSPESSFSRWKDRSSGRQVITQDMWAEPDWNNNGKPSSQAENIDSDGDDDEDEDSIEALLAEATNLAAFNFCDSNENTEKVAGESGDNQLVLDHSLFTDNVGSRGGYVVESNLPSPTAPRKENKMMNRLFGYGGH